MAKKKTITAKRKKELKRVRQFIKRAEKRGYKFSEDFKLSIAGKTTRALQALTPRKIYEQSEFEVTPGTFIPGKLGRAREREYAALKAAETRLKKKLEEERAEKEARQPEEEEEEYIPTEEEITYATVKGMIDEYPSRDGSIYLDNLLKSEVNKYGLTNVMRAMAKSDRQIIKLAHEIIYYELTSQQLHEALRDFSLLIRSALPTKEESKEENEVLESLSDES